MRVYSLTELFCMTRRELFALHGEIVAELAAWPLGSTERSLALSILRDIRRALSHPRNAPS